MEALSHNEDLSVEMLFEGLTPGRKRVALAAVELYKRMQERKFEKQVVKSSEDVYKSICNRLLLNILQVISQKYGLNL